VPGRPEDSYLVLGTSEKLTIAQIETLQDLQDVHLVVLSACETALGGPDQDGIEISGILKEGAKAVVASLWSVSDKSTSDLMQIFYSNLAGADPITKAEALRRAQLALLSGQPVEQAVARGIGVVAQSGGDRGARTSRYSHPYYWAPFILIGNGL